MSHRRFIVLALILTTLHIILTLGFLLISYMNGMDRFDVPESAPSTLDKILERTTGVLMQPGLILWKSCGDNASDLFEWIVFLGNSFLWGAFSAIAVRLLGKGLNGYLKEPRR